MILLFFIVIGFVSGYQNGFIGVNQRQPTILGVSAMCGLNGITVSIEFDQPFTGKIYSLNYENVHECIYYNAQEMKNVLFTIPLHRCGTRVTRNTREIIDTVENRVYVQMEKFTQTALDRQYSFLCELVHSRALLGINGANNAAPAITNDIRRHPGRTQIGNNLPVMSEPQGNPIQPIPVYHNSFPLFPPQTQPQSQSGYAVSPQQGFMSIPVPPMPQPLPQPPPMTSSSFNSIPYQKQQYIVPTNVVNYPNNEKSWNSQSNSIVPVVVPPHSPYIESNVGGKTGEERKTTQQQSFSSQQPLQSSSSSSKYYITENVVSPLIPENPPQNTNSITTNSVAATTAENNKINERNFLQKLPIQSSSAEPVRIYATQQVNKSEEALGNIYLEIQDGDGPRANTVNKPVKIGDKITLVIKSDDVPKDEKQYNLFVHSCYASDGPGTTRIELIDKSGCAASSQILGNMQRERDSKTIIYFFKLTAFKFPGPDDVYFSCLVDVSPNYNFPELCNKNSSTKKRAMSKRELITANVDSIPLFNDIKVNLNNNEENMDHHNLQKEGNLPLNNIQESSENHFCLSLFSTVFLFSVILALTLGFVFFFITTLILFLRLKKQQKLTK